MRKTPARPPGHPISDPSRGDFFRNEVRNKLNPTYESHERNCEPEREARGYSCMNAEVRTTTVNLDTPAWEWLKRRAAEDAIRSGGKPSASRVLRELIRDERQREAEPGPQAA